MALNLASADAEVKGRLIDNQLKLSQLRKLEMTAPPGPSIVDKPLERTMTQPGLPAQEVGHVPDVGYARTATGFAPVPSQDVKNRIEDQVIPEAMWSLRNNLLPTIGLGEKPSNKLLPPGYKDWFYHPLKQEWQPTKKYLWSVLRG